MENMVKSEILDFYKNKRVFITGHTGFKGAWLSKILELAGAEITGYALAPEPCSLFNIAGVERSLNSIIGDIRDIDALFSALNNSKPEIVFHLAAQPIVREGYKDPVYTYSTNVMGTVNLLECIRRTSGVKSVVNITTDKVYENKGWVWGYRETDALNGYDPYANSKSCSELVSAAFKNSYFNELDISLSTVRAGNVIGGGDFAKDRIIPDCVRAAHNGVPIEVRNPYSIRPYQHVLEPLAAYMLIAKKQFNDIKYSDCYNIGPQSDDCLRTEQLADIFCAAWGGGTNWIQIKNKGPHEDSILKLNCDKAYSILKFKPKWDAKTAVIETVDWYKAYYSDNNMAEYTSRQIEEYVR